MKRKYHYEYEVYTDNLCFGRIFLGRASNKTEANMIGNSAQKGCFVVERVRVND